MDKEQVVTTRQGHVLTQPLGAHRSLEAENRESLLGHQSLLRPAPSKVRLWMKPEPLQ